MTGRDLLFIVVGVIAALALQWLRQTQAFQRGTIVFMRETDRPNCRHWESEVHYDAWGSPYVFCAQGLTEIGLHRNGTTTDTRCWGTQWKHKSGPAISFGTRPEKAFEEVT